MDKEEIQQIPQPFYLILLKLRSERYLNISSFDEIHKAKRAFTLFKWQTKEYQEEETWDQDKTGLTSKVTGVAIISKTTTKYYGRYEPWLFFNGYKWDKYSSYGRKYTFKQIEQGVNHIMIRSHLGFKTEYDFRLWLGNTNYVKLFSDLLKF
jgi:hypothetical protein